MQQHELDRPTKEMGMGLFEDISGLGRKGSLTLERAVAVAVAVAVCFVLSEVSAVKNNFAGGSCPLPPSGRRDGMD